MKRREIDITATTPAAPQAIYALLADGSTWPSWSPIDSFELERVGETEREGVGAIRVFRMGRTTGRDEILELVPNRKLTYASLSGLPVRDYVGQVDLQSAPGGSTVIHWHSSFSPARPGTGWMLQRGIRRFLGQCANGLARYSAAEIDAGAA